MTRALGGLVVLVAMLCPSGALAAEVTFPSLPWTQYWTAPPQVSSATFDVYGAQGATSFYFPDSPGGLGGHTTATMKVIPGHRYSITVGAYGQPDQDPTKPSEGGEGSEVRSDSTPSSIRLIAAGGGGGGPAGGPGGAEHSQYGSIDAGGVSWGPPGAVYEVGVREGNGLVTISYDPNTFIESGPSGLTNDNTPTFTFATNRGGTDFQCFDEFTFGTCSGPGATHTTEPLADGRHTVVVSSTDEAGNADPTPATRSFRVDTKAPAVRVTGGPKNTVETKSKRAKVRVGFKSNERRRPPSSAASTRAPIENCDSPYSVSAKAKRRRGAKHKISVRGTDAAGNSASPVFVRFSAVRTH